MGQRTISWPLDWTLTTQTHLSDCRVHAALLNFLFAQHDLYGNSPVGIILPEECYCSI